MKRDSASVDVLFEKFVLSIKCDPCTSLVGADSTAVLGMKRFADLPVHVSQPGDCDGIGYPLFSLDVRQVLPIGRGVMV